MKTAFKHLPRSIALVAALALTLAPAAFGRSGPLTEQETAVRVSIQVGGTTVMAILYDNPSAHDFAAMLPLDLDVENYGSNEKIAYLPRKLTNEGAGPFSNETPGDLAYYAPWGNIIFYYGDYQYSSGLIRLGRIEGSLQPLLAQDKYRVHVELVQ